MNVYEILTGSTEDFRQFIAARQRGVCPGLLCHYLTGKCEKSVSIAVSRTNFQSCLKLNLEYVI